MVQISNSITLGAVIANAIVCSCIAAPVTVYFIIGFHRLSESVMIQKRYPRILKYLAISILLWLGISLPIMGIDFAELDQISGRNKEIIRRITASLYPWCSHGIFFTTTWRFWHIYFDLKYSSSQRNSAWKYHLDPSLVEHNFWLTHKKDYGSLAYTTKIVSVLYVVVTLSVIFNYQCFVWSPDYYVFIGHAWSIFTAGTAGVLALVLYWKTPEYADHFFIRYEMKITALMLLSTLVVAFSFTATTFFLPTGFVMVWCIFLGSVMFFGMATVSFWLMPRKIRFRELEVKLASLAAPKEESVQSESAQHGNTLQNKPLEHIVHRLSVGHHGNTSRQTRKAYKLHAILSQNRSFKLFMQHLAKEFSTECLLCFCEIIQYKYAVKQRFDRISDKYITDKMNVKIECPLHEIVPMSLIIKQGFNEDLSNYKPNDDESILVEETKKVLLQLFRKYICTGSELEVNVSYHDRTRLINLMSSESWFMELNSDPNELFGLLDDVATAMFRLMDGSYIRFKQTPQFEVACREVDAHSNGHH